jgi:hypothetical protein
MERHDVRMFTSAWGKRYVDSMRGTWMPLLGVLEEGTYINNEETTLHDEGQFINPCQVIIVPMIRVRDIDITITVTYKTAKLSDWQSQNTEGFSYDFPVYEHEEEKVHEFVIPAFTEAEAVFLFPDNNVYEIVSVVQGEGRGVELFSFFALASPTPRYLFGLGWDRLYSNFVRLKRGTFSSLEYCGTCIGTGEFLGEVCPECNGYLFSGPNASGPVLDTKSREVGISRNTGEGDEQFAKRVWARKWTLIPMEEEIVRYFKHFAHAEDDDIEIIKFLSLDEPTYFVGLDGYNLGPEAIWQMGEDFENWADLVKLTPPAGVNAFFLWLSSGEDPFEIVDDGTPPLVYTEQYDPYGGAFGGSEFMVTGFNEMRDFLSPCTGHYKAWESFYDGVHGSPPSGWTISNGELVTVDSFLGHNKCAWAKDRDDTGDFVFATKSIDISGEDFFQYDYYCCMLEPVNSPNFNSVGVHLQVGGNSFNARFYHINGEIQIRLVVNGATYGTALIGAKAMRWYHLHVEGNKATGKVDVYVDGIHKISNTVPGGVLVDYTSAVISSTSAAYAGFVVDAIDGSWDPSYCAQSDGSTCVTRNMIQVNKAPRLNNWEYPLLANPVVNIPINHWIQGFEYVDVQVHKWIPSLYGHDSVIEVTSPFDVAFPKYNETLEYWYMDSPATEFVHRRVMNGIQRRKVYDDHILVAESVSPSLVYTIDHDYVSGIVISPYPYANTFGGRSIPSYRTQRNMPDEYNVHGLDISIVDEWKGMSLPICMKSNPTMPQYIEDVVSIGNVDGWWSAWIFVDPDHDAEFSVEFYDSVPNLAWRCYIKNGNLYNNSDVYLATFGNKGWHHIKLDYDVTNHDMDITIDDVLQVSNDPFVTSTDPFASVQIGWKYPVQDSVAYTCGIQSSEVANVDETVDELPDADGIDLQSAILYRTRGMEYQARQHQPENFILTHDRKTHGILSVLSQENVPSRRYAFSWVGDRLVSFPRAPKISKFHKGTYNFKDGVLRGWLVDQPSNTLVSITPELEGHRNVATLHDDNASDNAEISQYFGNRESGEVEFFVRNGDETKEMGMAILGDAGIAVNVRFDTYWRYYDGSWKMFDGSPASVQDKWYHVHVKFRCDTDTFQIWVDGIQFEGNGGGFDIPFQTACTSATSLRFYTQVSPADYTIYVDAIGYSWDPFYMMEGDSGYELEAPTAMLLQMREFSSDFTTKDTVLWTRKPVDTLNYNEENFLYKAGESTGPLYLGFTADTEHDIERDLDGHRTAVKLGAGHGFYRDVTSHGSGAAELWFYDDGDNYYQINMQLTTTLRFRFRMHDGYPGDRKLRYYESSTDKIYKRADGTDVEVSKGWHHLYFQYNGTTYGAWLNGVRIYGQASETNIPYQTTGNIDRMDLRSSYDFSYFDAMGWSEDPVYAIGDNRYPWEAGKSDSLVAYNGSIIVDGRSVPYKILDKDSVILVSKGLNNIS